MWAKCPAHFILLILMVLTLPGGQYKARSSSLSKFLQVDSKYSPQNTDVTNPTVSALSSARRHFTRPNSRFLTPLSERLTTEVEDSYRIFRC